MARYCLVTNQTRPSVGTIMTEFNVMDDSTSPPTVYKEGLTLGFLINPAQTYTQNFNRMVAEFKAYVEQIVSVEAALDQHFDSIKAQAAGFRWPAAS